MKLPDSVQEIADVIGREQALLLISKLPRSYSLRKSGAAGSATRDGGKRVMQGSVNLYVPRVPKLNANHQLVQILGWHDAIKLCKAFGGEIMYPANCAAYYRQERNQGILDMLADGMTPTEVAAEVGLTVEQVRRIRREKPPEELRAAANDNALVDNKARA
jgi:hypothetical protein